MKDTTLRLKFENHQNPNSKFDVIKLEDLLKRDNLDHDPCQLHKVEFYIILFVSGGEGSHTIDFTDFKCKKGTILTIRKDQIHKFFKSNLKGNLLLFTNDFLSSYLEKLEAIKTLQLFNELLGNPIIQLNNSEMKEISDIIYRIQDEYFNVNDKHSFGIIRSELHILLVRLYRIKSSREDIIIERKYLNEFIEFQKLVEQNVTKTTKVKDYSQMMGYSTKTINNISKSIVNKTAKEFIDEICIKQIKRFLINTDESIKEIAYATGFEETTNFYKYFKRHTSTTPEQFRFTVNS